MVAFGGGGASLVDDDSDRVHHEDEGHMANPNLGSLGPRDAPERAGDKGGGVRQRSEAWWWVMGAQPHGASTR
jgi:hypothetical protein